MKYLFLACESVPYLFLLEAQTDSTIAPPEKKTVIFFNKRFYGCSIREKILSNDDVGVARGAVYQEIRPPEAGFKTGDFVKEKLGGLP